MKITICGSINSSDKIIEAAEKLEEMGHQVNLPYYTVKIRNGEITLAKYRQAKEKNGSDLMFREEAKEDLIKRFYNFIIHSDAILVINVDKGEKKNHIGGNSFLEMGFAYVADKPIYLLNEIPDNDYKDEIIDMKPIVTYGDLEKIK